LNSSDLRKKIEEMIIIEEAQSQHLSANIKTLTHTIVKETLNAVALDSKEHAGFYRAIHSLLLGENQPIIEDEYMRLENIIRSHIQVEARMQQAAEELLETIDDTRVKHILREILQDEIRHHKLMQTLLDSVVKRTLMEDEIWDMIWRDVPGHGAPIG
jgi:rubrerythrin